MKVSIITIAFNAEDTIAETIESVIAQDYGDVEYIIIDGGSTDSTLDIISRYEGKIDTLISEPDRGVYDAMNKGIKAASGDVVGILNADDVFAYPEVLSDVIRLLESSGAESCYADLIYVDRVNPNKIFRHWVSGPFKRSSFKRGWMPPHPTFFVKRTVYTFYGLFNTTLRTSADYELMLRLLYRHALSTVYLPKTIVYMKMGGQSNRSVKNRLAANREDRLAWRMNGLKPSPFIGLMKPIRKVGQFLKK